MFRIPSCCYLHEWKVFLARRAVRYSPTLSLHTAVDEQNAQTQEQEGFLLSLSASEEGKELRNEDKISMQSSHSSSYGVSKGRIQRKGTALELPPCQSRLWIAVLLTVKREEVVMYIIFCVLKFLHDCSSGLAHFCVIACALYSSFFAVSLMAGP